MADYVAQTYQFAGCPPILLEAEESIQEAYRSIFGHCFLSNTVKASVETGLHARVSIGERGVEVFIDGLLAGVLGSFSEVPPLLETLTCFYLVRSRRDKFAIHASGVMTPKGALLFPADKGSGKSTLSLWLSRRGYPYLGDELIWIDPGTATVESFPKAAAIKAGSFSLFPEVATTFQSATRGSLRYYSAPQGVSPEEALPIIGFAFPVFSPGSESVLKPLLPPQTLFALAQVVFGGLANREHVFRALCTAADRPAFALFYRDAPEAETLLSDIGLK